MKCHLNNISREAVISLGENVLKINENFKECWVSLLEIYSLSFNP
jgi:hypothetical protein